MPGDFAWSRRVGGRRIGSWINLSKTFKRSGKNILCFYRFLNPKASLRISGGREVHLRSLQAMGLYVANSIFIGDYLTTKGQAAEADLEMIRDLGFEIENDPVSSSKFQVSGSGTI